MIRMIFVFLVLYAVFFFGILGFRQLSGKQKWELTKMLTYSAMCAILAVIFLIVIVFLF